MHKNIKDITEMKGKEKITVLTGYDSTMVTLCDQVDVILVGDSAGMVMLGYEDTTSVTMEDMIRFTTAVKNARKNALIVSDLPINSYQTEEDAIANSLKLIQAGADAVKLEGGKEVAKIMPQPKIFQTELIKPKEQIVAETIQPKIKEEDKIEIIQSITPKPTLETKPDLDKEVAKITEYKALPEPQEKSKVSISDEDIDEDTDDLDKIKSDIMRVLSKLDQAEVE